MFPKPLRSFILASVVLCLLASPATASLQRGEHASSRPALLADRLLLATEEIRQAGSIGQTFDGRPAPMTADIPRWIRSQLEAADRQLCEASYDTVDPAEQDRIGQLRSTTLALCAVLDEQRASVRPRLVQLQKAISGLARAIGQRVQNRLPGPAPRQRPPLETPPR